MAVSDDLTNLTTVLSAVVVPTGSKAIVRIYTMPDQRLVTTAETPCFLILWKQAPKTKMATFGTVWETRQYTVNFLYKPVGQGTLHDDISELIAYRQATLNALYGHIRLFSTVLGQYPIQCGIAQELPEAWNGQSFIGFPTTLTVIEQRSLVFGS